MIDASYLMGFDAPLAENAEFTEWKMDALANQATPAVPPPEIWV